MPTQLMCEWREGMRHRELDRGYQELDRSRRMFHICSHGSRDARDRAEPGLEGAYAMRQWLSAGNEINAQVRLPQAA